MKKLWLFIPGILLVAAGCNSNTSTSSKPATNQNSGYHAPAVNNPAPTKTVSKTTNPTTSPTTQQTIPKPTTQATSTNFTVSADDSGASLTNILVTKGQQVKITFQVSAKNVYHAGLDFRSSVISTGTISSGQSKTIIFTANQSFDFTPYWPASNTKKPYLIHVIVK